MAKTGFHAVRWMQQRSSDKRGGSRGKVALPEVQTPLEKYAMAYMEYLAVLNRTPAALKSRAVDIRFFLAWAAELAIQTPRDVTATKLEDYQRRLWDHRRKTGQPLSVSTQRSRLGAVRQLFGWLLRRGIIKASPAALIEMPKAPKRLPASVLSHGEVQRLLRQPRLEDGLGIRDRAMLEVLYATGIRRAELAALELTDISWEHPVLRVRQGKGRKDRMVPLGRRARDWVRRYVKEVRSCLTCRDDEQALFLSGYGGPMNVDVLGRVITGYIARIDRKGGCHMTRRTCATHMLEGGADIRHIQKLLGHEKLETTALYAEVSIIQLQAVHAKCHPSERRYRGLQGTIVSKWTADDMADHEGWPT